MRLGRQGSSVAVDDPAERVADVLTMKRELLLAVHRHRLGREDLEDCLSQAALELVGRARAGQFAGDDHIANALEQKFLSRVADRQRALAGRSAIVAAAHDAIRIGVTERDDAPAFDIPAVDAEPSTRAVNREQLQRVREVAAELTDDQRLVLACQVSLGIESGEFCRRYGWSPEKFKKVAQRARARLSKLVSEYEAGDRCRRLEADVLAYAANIASAAQMTAVREHLVNCHGCAAHVRGLRLASGRVAAVLPVPALVASHAIAAKLGPAAKLHAVWRAVTAPFGRIGASGASSIGAGGLAKASIATVCVAALEVGGHVAGAGKDHPRVAPTTHAQAVVSRAATTTPATTPGSDVLRATDISRARSADGKRRIRPHHSKRRDQPRRRRAAARTVSRAATAPPPTLPPPAAPPPTPPPLAARRIARAVQLPPPTAHATPRAPEAHSGTEFGVE